MRRRIKRLRWFGAIGLVIALAALCGCTGTAAGSAAGSAAPSTMAASPTASATADRTALTKAAPITGLTIVHTVQPGENLYRIARRYGTSVQAILQANGLADPALITVGQKLIIPNIPATTEPEPTATPIPATATPLVYTATPRGPSPTSDPHATPSPTPLPPDNVNGVKIEQIVGLSPTVQENVRQIFAKGQKLGYDPHHFTRIGDSIIEHPHFMVAFDTGIYQLGQYAYLQDVLDYYKGSFGRDSLAVRRGLHSWSWANPTWADKDQCLPDEGPVACEYRVYKPSIAFIVLGSNDVGVPDYFRRSMDDLVKYTITQGVIPIIGTKADRHEGPDNINNGILRDIATKYNIPLWDFDAVAGTMPNRGIDPTDGTHLTFYFSHDYTKPEAFTKGHAVQDLTAVIMLDKLWRVLGLNQH